LVQIFSQHPVHYTRSKLNSCFSFKLVTRFYKCKTGGKTIQSVSLIVSSSVRKYVFALLRRIFPRETAVHSRCELCTTGWHWMQELYSVGQRGFVSSTFAR
jgi:hypothetical protein